MMCGIYFRNDNPLPVLINMKAACKSLGNMQQTASATVKEAHQSVPSRRIKGLFVVFASWTQNVSVFQNLQAVEVFL